MVETLELDIKGNVSSNRHYNIDSITHLCSVENEMNPLGWILIALPTIVSLGFIPLIDYRIIFVGFFVSFIAFAKIHSSDTVELGTLNETDNFSLSNAKTIEDTFKGKVSEKITVSGRKRDTTNTMEYTYHFVPENIVSMEKVEDSVSLLLFIAFLAAFVVLLYSIMIAVSTSSGYIGWVIIVSFIALLVIGYVISKSKNYRLLISLQNGEKIKFSMHETDIDRTISRFKK